ncbi:PoNe immunity protein domain-containing protein [Pseudomonas xanthosomatis]|uniref:PoNe immunity protein domain-containing protein n=1 Tax=Pseudomonas xanthosomatis TaxID=2842356 RepID=UPI003518BDCB
MKRRQQFVTEGYYKSMLVIFDEIIRGRAIKPLPGDTAEESAFRTSSENKDILFMRLMLKYTAGEDISSLEEDLEVLIDAFERFQKDFAVYEGVSNISPLNIEDAVFQYQEFVQIVGFCVLLHRRDLLGRFVALTDAAGFDGEDMLYEDLVKKVLPARYEINEFYHELYRPLVESVYAESVHEKSKLLNDYCVGWYAAFAKIPNYWHDTHLSMTEEDGSYFGYWVVEAAAIAYLYDIDDSKIDHMVYPKDLVEYARSFTVKKVGGGPSKVYSGQKCTKAGYWFSPAMPDSRRYFNEGEVMPEFKGASWGATIWYWSGEE